MRPMSQWMLCGASGLECSQVNSSCLEGIEIVVTRWEPPHVQADRAEYGGVELTFTHSFVSTGPGGEGNAVIIRLDIDGPRADEIGPGIGSQIAADFPQTADALVRAARVSM